MFDSLNGIITFEAVAPDTTSFVNLLKESCVAVDNLRYKNSKIIGKIYKKDFSELKKIGNMCNAQIDVIDKKGIIFLAAKYKKRIGLIAGAVLAAFLVIFLSDTVMIIDVYGNDNISDSYVLSLLNDAGIYIGANISDIDLRSAERIVVSSSDEISWIGIRSSGCKIQAEVCEFNDTPEIVQKNIPCNIVSTKDAQIVEIRNVYSGMLVQMLNNGVKKGDLLISGTVEDGKGGVYYTHSRGEIIGRYVETIIFTQPYYGETIAYEDEVTYNTIHFFGIRLPLNIRKEKFDNYEFDEDITYLKLLDMQLPVGMIYSHYKPYTINDVEYDTEQARAMLNEKIKLYEYNFLSGEDTTVVDKNVEFTEMNNSLKVTVKYTVEGNIGISKEIMVKK